jgi:ice-binding like protein
MIHARLGFRRACSDTKYFGGTPMVMLSRRSARLLVIPLVALLAAACEHNDLGTGTTTGGGPGPGPGPSLGTAATYGILAGASVTCASSATFPSTINADVGISPGSTLTGFPPCIVTGSTNLGNSAALTAQSYALAAYNDLAGMPCPPANNVGTVDMGGTTKAAGVYCSGSTLGVTGTLTLDGGGNSNALFVFQAGSALTTGGANPNIKLINGAQAKNVWWQIGSSATIGTNNRFLGNIVAFTSITLSGADTLIGRALALNGSVVLSANSDVITLP